MIQTFNSKVKTEIGLIAQPNDYTCQSTCIAMVTGNPDVMGIREKLEAIGDPGAPTVMGKLLTAKFGDRYAFHPDASLDQMRDWIKSGAFLIVHTYLTPSGHVIAIDGVEIDPATGSYSFHVLDPWSEFNAPSWTYDLDQYGFSGNYSSYLLYAAAIAGQSCDDAQNLYEQGELDCTQKEGWVHVINP